MDTQSDVKNHVAVNNDRLDYTRNCTENEQSTSTNVSESCVPQHNQDVQISLCVTNDCKEGSDFNPTDDVVSDSVCFTSNTELELDQNNVCESSNDMDEEQNCEGDITSSVFTKSRSRKLCVIDSDSEEENEHEHQINKSDYQNEIQNSDNLSVSSKNSIEDNDVNSNSENEAEQLIENDGTEKHDEHENSEYKKMTSKEASKQRQEIHSESQRRTREATVSLPYHKPKTRSITEFLKKRPCLATAIPLSTKVPPSVAIKMSSQNLEFITKQFEERKKEVQKFYESESESDEEQNTPGEVTENTESNSTVETCVSGNQTEKEVNCIDNVVDECAKETEEISTDLVQEDTEISKVDDIEKAIHDSSDSVCIINKDAKQSTSIEDKDMAVTEALSPNVNMNDKSVLLEDDTSENIAYDITTEEDQQASEDYDFNLDNISIEDEDHSNEEENHLNMLINKYSDKNKNHEETQTDSINEVKVGNRSNLLQLYKENITAKPRLSGNPDELIDLTDNPKQSEGVTHLIERFMKHACPQNTVKDKIKMNVVTVSNGELHKQTVTISNDSEEQPVSLVEKPGAKHQKLRGELQQQILQRRSEHWQQKTVPGLTSNTAEKSENDFDEEAILDDAEEEDVTDSELSSSEDEDVDLCDTKPKVKSAFVDDEAEESDVEDEVDEDDEENDVVEDDLNEAETNDLIKEKTNDIQSNEEDIASNHESSPVKTKKLKRIISTFSDDSDDEQESNVTSTLTEENEKEVLSPKDSTMSWEDDDDIPPPHQKQSSRTPIRNVSQVKSDFDFLSPVINLTGLQNFNSASKYSPITTSPFAIPAEPSPFKNKLWKEGLQKKLFPDLNEMSDTQVVACTNEPTSDMDQSGSFSEPQKIVEPDPETQADDNMPSTQDLKDICSGRFTATSSTNISNEISVQNDTSLNQQSSVTSPVSKIITYDEEIKATDDQDDQFISQLLDEEELERFKKKFDSPVINPEIDTYKQIPQDDDSDDEEIDEINPIRRRKRQRKLVFSDDEESMPSENNKDVDDDASFTEEADYEKVDYDSEENEVEYVQKEETATKLKDFFENEAELSESDWDSEDEDEKGLDTLEFEQADNENYDEDKMKTALEKIHMRRILDDDNREVKILQELLLDDGELHGIGRKRQFKWKNIDMNIEDDKENDDESDTYVEEDDEEEWRRKRFERQKYFTKQMEKSQSWTEDNVEVDEDSKILKLGQTALYRSQSSSQTTIVSEKTHIEVEHIAANQSLVQLGKRGSFLTRTDKVLNRLAQFTKVSNEVIIGAPKTSKSFVFQSCQPAVSNEVNVDKKRKATSGTPQLLKKLRLNDASPGVRKETAKSKRAKNLFKF